MGGWVVGGLSGSCGLYVSRQSGSGWRRVVRNEMTVPYVLALVQSSIAVGR